MMYQGGPTVIGSAVETVPQYDAGPKYDFGQGGHGYPAANQGQGFNCGKPQKPEAQPSSSFGIADGFGMGPAQDWSEGTYPEMVGEDRANFIRKVYGILSAQMGITAVICAVAMFVPPVQAAFVAMMVRPWASVALFIPAMCVLCALQAKKAEHPTNYYLLLAFTVLMALGVAGVCAVYQHIGAGHLILQAFTITMITFGSLSLYALKSGKDFTWMGGMLAMGLMGMMAFSLLGMLFGFSGGIFFSLFGVVLFSGYVLYDTSRILKELGPDDALVAAIELYLDILNLFLYILELLSQCQQQD